MNYVLNKRKYLRYPCFLEGSATMFNADHSGSFPFLVIDISPRDLLLISEEKHAANFCKGQFIEISLEIPKKLASNNEDNQSSFSPENTQSKINNHSIEEITTCWLLGSIARISEISPSLYASRIQEYEEKTQLKIPLDKKQIPQNTKGFGIQFALFDEADAHILYNYLLNIKYPKEVLWSILGQKLDLQNNFFPGKPKINKS